MTITATEDEEAGMELQLGSPGWIEFSPVKGQIIEVFLAASDILPEVLAWAPMLIVNVTMSTDNSSLQLECKSLGGVDPEVDSSLSGLFNRRKGVIHLCVVHPCEDILGEFYHATRIRWWRGGIATYPGGSASGRRQVDKWLVRDEAPFGGPEAHGRNPARIASAKTASTKKAKLPGAGSKAVPSTGRKDTKPKSGETEEIGEEKRKALLKKLKELKARVRGPVLSDVTGPEEDVEPTSSAEEVESSPALEELTTGTSLFPSGVAAASKKIKDRAEEKKRKGPEADLSLVASRGSTTKGYQGQLVGKALAVSQTKAEVKKKSSSSSSRLGSALAKILTKEVAKKKGKKRKKKEKKKKKKKRKGGGSPGGDGDGDGPSSSQSSSGETDNSELGSSRSGESQSSEEELEAPLRKRSKKNPGSVLELLVAHAREQLDQSASVGVGKEEDRYLTSGIKLMTYFQVLLKPKLGGSQALQREMHHLATAIDLLRQGRLGLLGDTLAARFLCLHQSILDGHWGAARHLEIFPMEETSAASTALLLQTRKHARLAAKAMGADGGGGSWQSYGRGVKGKGKQDWQGGEWKDGKGKGKKGGKGKTKKGRQQWWQDSDKQGEQDWKESKDSKGDK